MPVANDNLDSPPIDMTAASILLLAACLFVGLPAVALWLGLVWR